MNRYSALAMSALAMGAAALTSTEASAMPVDPRPASATEAYEWPDEGTGYPGSEAKSLDCTYPEDPACNVPPLESVTAPSPTDDSGAEVLQAGASALGGAGVAFGGMWLYRRRQVLAS